MKHVKTIVLFSSLLFLFAGCTSTNTKTTEDSSKSEQSSVEKTDQSNTKNTNETKLISNLLEPTKIATDTEKKQVSDIESINYRLSNENGVIQGVDINFKANEKIIFIKDKTKEHIAIKDVTGIDSEDVSTIKIDDSFKEKLMSTNFNSWKDKYENKEITDGTLWEVIVNYTDGTSKISSGVNDSPDTFKDFEDLILEK